MPRRVACCLALVLSCCAIYCRHSRPRIEEPLLATPELRLELYFNTRTRPFGNTRAEIIKNLGKPKLERTEKDLDRAGQLTSEEKRCLLGHISEPINQIIELAYDGLLLRILKVNTPPYREIFYYMTVTSSRYRMLWNLNVGSPRQEIRRILGDPSNPNDTKDSYNAVDPDDLSGLEYANLVIFGYKGNLVDKISFSMSLD